MSPEWVVTFNAKHSNAITIEACGEVVLNIRFASLEVRCPARDRAVAVLLQFCIESHSLLFAAVSEVERSA